MISVIISSHFTSEKNSEYEKYLRNLSGVKDIEFITIENHRQYPLSEAYNIGINKSSHDYIVCMHNDIKVEKNWALKLVKHLDKGTHPIIGLAGTTSFPKSCMWWEDPSKMIGIVKHQSEGKTWESRYSTPQGYDIKDVVIVDGLFIGFDKTKVKSLFDDTIPGFHFYDLGFCLPNYLAGIKIGVVTDIRVTHLSIGATNEEWNKNRLAFAERYDNFLPITI